MKIALDYDGTYTEAPDFWDNVIALAQDYGHDIRIVTARNPKADVIDDNDHEIIYCDGIAKRFYCHWFADGFDPDIWIDDRPESIDNNSKATKEDLKIWRETRV